MGNLGLYEVITTEAKLAGGVDSWLKAIEDAAVAERSSEYLLKGVALGALFASATGGAVYGVRAAWAGKQRKMAAAAEARRQLEGTIAGQLAADSLDDDHGVASAD